MVVLFLLVVVLLKMSKVLVRFRGLVLVVKVLLEMRL